MVSLSLCFHVWYPRQWALFRSSNRRPCRSLFSAKCRLSLDLNEVETQVPNLKIWTFPVNLRVRRGQPYYKFCLLVIHIRNFCFRYCTIPSFYFWKSALTRWSAKHGRSLGCQHQLRRSIWSLLHPWNCLQPASAPLSQQCLVSCWDEAQRGLKVAPRCFPLRVDAQ